MDHFKNDFKDKCVLVTGSTSGLGAAIAIRFSKLGAKVGILGRKKNRLREVAAKCPVKILCMKADLANDEECKCVAKTFIDKYGRIDVLVNAASLISLGTIESTKIDQFDKIMNTNIRSMYHITMLLAPELIKTKGCIVNVSSLCGPRVMSNLLSFSVSKAAVQQFTHCVAIELGPKGVRCNAVNPCSIEKLLHKKKLIDDVQYREHWMNYKRTHPIPRDGEDDEVVLAVLFFASKLSTYITGAALPVDGGRHIMNPQ